jgi:hypothetical protein
VIIRLRHFFSLPAAERRAYLMMAGWLVGIRLMLKITTFEQITNFVSRRPIATANARVVSLARLAAIIQSSGARLPGTCLSRSLAGAVILARFGYPSQVQIGVSTDKDFAAHAWLECGGTPITEPYVDASRWKELTRVTVGP